MDDNTRQGTKRRRPQRKDVIKKHHIMEFWEDYQERRMFPQMYLEWFCREPRQLHWARKMTPVILLIAMRWNIPRDILIHEFMTILSGWVLECWPRDKDPGIIRHPTDKELLFYPYTRPPPCDE
jgi:hypothetical protein